MPKNEPTRPDVIWNLSNDAIQPKPAPWGFIAQNPVQRVLPPGGKAKIDTGIAASCPLLAFPRGEADHVTVQQLIPAGTNIVVMVENRSSHTSLVIDDKEALVNLHPLVFNGTAGVG